MVGEGLIRWTGGAPPVAHLSGEVDLINCHSVFAAIGRTAEDAGAVVVDLTEAQFIDSTSIASLLQLTRKAIVRVVAPPGSQPRRVIELLELADAIPVFATIDDAITAS